jgi:peptide/nickel transport system substrate-binding protein
MTTIKVVIAALTVSSGALLATSSSVASASSRNAKSETAKINPPGGTLTIGANQTPVSLNPLDAAIAVPEEWYMDLAYAPFIVHDANGSYSPGLALSWGYVGKNNETFVMNLRPNVEFSDGSALTAAGAAAYINARAAGEGETSFGTTTPASVLGPLTVQVQTTIPNAALPFIFSQSFGGGWVVSPTGLANQNSLLSQTAGAGPYMLDTSATVTNSSYVYVPNPNYYDPSAIYWSKIVIEVITTPAAALAALETGQIQVMQGAPNLVKTAKSAGLNVGTEPGTDGPAMLVVNIPTKGPLASVKVRQALSYAINRPAIAKALFGKYATLDEELEAPGDIGYVPSLATYYDYNPTLAKKLLKEAGYPHGFKTAANCSPQVGDAQICEAVQSEWAAIGVKLTVSAPANQIWATQLFAGKYALTGIVSYPTTSAEQSNGYYLPGILIGKKALPGVQAAYSAAMAAPIGSATANADWAKLTKIEMLGASCIVPVSPDLVMFSSKSITGVDFSTANPEPYPLTWRPAS